MPDAVDKVSSVRASGPRRLRVRFAGERRVHDLNLTGLFARSRHFAPLVSDANAFGRAAEKVLTDSEFGFIVAKTERKAAHTWPPEKQKHTDGVEEKYRFLRYVERLEGIRIHLVVELGG